MIIKLSKYHLNKCEKFADDQLKGSAKLYAYRGESSKIKMREDIVIGKLAEVGACKFFKSKKPDFTIYERSKKSYSADLKLGNMRIHVKSQSKESIRKYGHSWLFQRSDQRAREINKWGECRVPRYRHSKVALYLKEIQDGYDH